jgi:type IV secretion system protein VirD4
VQFHVITQDFNQLKATYGDRWESFVANSGVLQTFGVRDLMTAEYVSKLLGDSTVYVLGESQSEVSKQQARLGFTGSAQNVNEARRPLLTPGEVMTLHESAQIVFPANGRPILCRKNRWFEEKPWVDRGKPPPSIFKPLLPLKAPVIVHGEADYTLGGASPAFGIAAKP